MRKEFKLTDEELADLLKIKPMPVVLIGGIDLSQLAQDLANNKWAELGRKHGFIWDTVKSVPGKSNAYFTAEVDPNFKGKEKKDETKEGS